MRPSGQHRKKLLHPCIGNVHSSWSWACLALLILLVPSMGCDDDQGLGQVIPTGILASFTTSTTSGSANLVRLGGGAAIDDRVTIDVVIGPTASQDLFAFAFDLVLGDPAVAKLVMGSGTAGTALSGPQIIVDAFQDGDRIIVGVTKLGGAGNGVGSEAIIISLTFQVLRVGATPITIEGSPQNTQNPTNDPAALECDAACAAGTSGLKVSTAVVFDIAPATPAMISGM